MYKFERYCQLGLTDFIQLAGLKMNHEKRWVRMAATIPWEAIEGKLSNGGYRNFGFGSRERFWTYGSNCEIFFDTNQEFGEIYRYIQGET